MPYTPAVFCIQIVNQLQSSDLVWSCASRVVLFFFIFRKKKAKAFSAAAG